MRKVLSLLTVLGALVVSAEGKAISLPVQQQPSEQEIQTQRDAYEAQQKKSNEWRQHLKVIDMIDRRDRF